MQTRTQKRIQKTQNMSKLEIDCVGMKDPDEKPVIIGFGPIPNLLYAALEIGAENIINIGMPQKVDNEEVEYIDKINQNKTLLSSADTKAEDKRQAEFHRLHHDMQYYDPPITLNTVDVKLLDMIKNRRVIVIASNIVESSHPKIAEIYLKFFAKLKPRYTVHSITRNCRRQVFI